jgi:hypothetical protein
VAARSALGYFERARSTMQREEESKCVPLFSGPRRYTALGME